MTSSCKVIAAPQKILQSSQGVAFKACSKQVGNILNGQNYPYYFSKVPMVTL